MLPEKDLLERYNWVYFWLPETFLMDTVHPGLSSFHVPQYILLSISSRFLVHPWTITNKFSFDYIKFVYVDLFTFLIGFRKSPTLMRCLLVRWHWISVLAHQTGQRLLKKLRRRRKNGLNCWRYDALWQKHDLLVSLYTIHYNVSLWCQDGESGYISISKLHS